MSGLRDRLAGKVTVGDDGFVRCASASFTPSSRS